MNLKLEIIKLGFENVEYKEEEYLAMGELGSNGNSDAGLLSHLHRNKIEKESMNERI